MPKRVSSTTAGRITSGSQALKFSNTDTVLLVQRSLCETVVRTLSLQEMANLLETAPSVRMGAPIDSSPEGSIAKTLTSDLFHSPCGCTDTASQFAPAAINGLAPTITVSPSAKGASPAFKIHSLIRLSDVHSPADETDVFFHSDVTRISLSPTNRLSERPPGISCS